MWFLVLQLKIVPDPMAESLNIFSFPFPPLKIEGAGLDLDDIESLLYFSNYVLPLTPSHKHTLIPHVSNK